MTTVATVEEKRLTVADVIDKLKPEIARALPRGMDADRLARLALTVIRESDLAARKAGKPQNSLNNCAPESFVGCLLTASALGLEPGVNGEAWLVPYKGECTLIIGYQGYAKLFWNHPLAKHLDAQAVHERDEFDYAYGLNQFLSHKPADGDRGKITHYWAAAQLSTGASAFVVLTADDVERLRGGKVGPSGQIPDPMHWMERKTGLRQLFKLLPKSTELAAAVVVDEQTGTVLAQRGVASAIASGEGVPQLESTRVVEDEPQRVTADEITGPRAARMISAGQSTKLHASLGDLGVTDRDDKLAFLTEFTGRDVTSSKDLSADEAKAVIDEIDRRIAQRQASAWIRYTSGLSEKRNAS